MQPRIEATLKDGAVWLRWGVAVLMFASRRAESVDQAYDLSNAFVDRLIAELQHEVHAP